MRTETEYDWCEERATSLVQTVNADETFEVTHVCRHNEEHEGPHSCQGCGMKWDGMEVPC